MRAANPWLSAVSEWWSRHRRRWRRRHLRAVKGGASPTLLELALRDAAEPPRQTRQLQAIERRPAWLPEPQWRKPRGDDPEPGAA